MYKYDGELYSKWFYPHITTFTKLLTGNRCVICQGDCFGKKGVTHHGAYVLPNGVKVLECELDVIGVLLYPLCVKCHKVAHNPGNTIFTNNYQGNNLLNYRNTPIMLEQMQQGWNKLVAVGAYKRDISEQIWRGF